MTDFTNWQAEREKLKQEILKELRNQRDQTGELRLRGRVTFDPRQISAVGDYTTFGPYFFQTGFRAQPILTFGQQLQTPGNVFIINPVIDGWHVRRGVVDGFTLGVYALTTVPVQCFKHVVTWMAEGLASKYTSEHMTDAWLTPYNLNQTIHLTQTNLEATRAQ